MSALEIVQHLALFHFPFLFNALTLLFQAKTRHELCVITFVVAPVSWPVEFELSNPGTTSRSG